MNTIEIAHNAHLQALKSLSILKEYEMHIYELIQENNYAEIVKEKEKYYKIVDSLTVLIYHLNEKYEALSLKERSSEEGQTLSRLFLNMEHFKQTLMP